jgi:hypothetical protein
VEVAAAERAHNPGWDQGIEGSAEEAACHSFGSHSCRNSLIADAATQAVAEEVWVRKRQQTGQHRMIP